jgi:hypothetical protein
MRGSISSIVYPNLANSEKTDPIASPAPAPLAVINADDYYGGKAYETMAAYLSSVPCHTKEHAMVGYLLKNTMSRSGAVTRGVCEVQDGRKLVEKI